MRDKRTRDRWDDADTGVRVLVECEPEGSPTIIASLLERHGFDVRTCEGPGSHPCDLVEHGSCGLVDGADVVVNLLRDRTDGPAIAQEVAGMRRPPALVVEQGSAPARAEVDAPTSHDVVTVASPVTRKGLIDGISDALRHRDDPPTWWGDGSP